MVDGGGDRKQISHKFQARAIVEGDGLEANFDFLTQQAQTKKHTKKWPP